MDRGEENILQIRPHRKRRNKKGYLAILFDNFILAFIFFLNLNIVLKKKIFSSEIKKLTLLIIIGETILN
uniref:Uncharacterized protein n=1 Tax=Meloidogyne enterolobii TaxID=390850 RepID=A0A6V7TM81_MELEN|nr:unnamed protein product [Meloidogyne enterolobii]